MNFLMDKSSLKSFADGQFQNFLTPLILTEVSWKPANNLATTKNCQRIFKVECVVVALFCKQDQQG